MAIWHFKFSLIPTEGLKRVFGTVDVAVVPEWVIQPDGPKYLELDELENLPGYWPNPATLRQIAITVSSFMPEMKSWSGEARMFGSDEDNRVEVWGDDVCCHINLRDMDFELLDQILSLARRFDCRLAIHGTGAVSAPDTVSLAPHVEASNAYKFCRNPAGFLASLNKSPPERDQ